MPKKILYLDHTVDRNYQPEQHFAPYLTLPYDLYHAPSGQLPASLEAYSHLIISGSPLSALDASDWKSREMELLHQAVAQGKNILGVCYGHQLLAQVLFGEDRVRRRATPEIGWVELAVLQDDALLGQAGTLLQAFVSHADEVHDLPADRAEIILRSQACAIHGYRLKGQPVWGLQTHFEITPAQGQATIDALFGPGTPEWPYVQKYDNPRDSEYGLVLFEKFQAL